MAEHWATNNVDAPEVELYRPFLREPVLDAGCGTGRLLGPWHDEGIDIDGCGASADMVAWARRRAPGATLWVSALHELDPPRQYGTIVVCGVFGLGSRTSRRSGGCTARCSRAGSSSSTTRRRRSPGGCATGTSRTATGSRSRPASTPSTPPTG